MNAIPNNVRKERIAIAFWAVVIVVASVSLLVMVARYNPAIWGDKYQRMDTAALVSLFEEAPKDGPYTDEMAREVELYRIVKVLKTRAQQRESVERGEIVNALRKSLSLHHHTDYVRDLCILVLSQSLGTNDDPFIRELEARQLALLRNTKRGEEVDVAFHMQQTDKAIEACKRNKNPAP